MENSSLEALMTGVNILIFVVALTIAITLMTGVINLSNIASENVKETRTNALKETNYESELQRIINGKEVLKLNMKKSEAEINDLSRYEILVIVAGAPQPLSEFCNNYTVKAILSMKFMLIGMNDNLIHLIIQ